MRPPLVPLALLLAGCPTAGALPPDSGEPGPGEVIVDPYATPFTSDAGLEPGQIALTFDDGPEPVTTGRILDILDAHGVRATFFQVGQFAEQHPEVTADVVARGHSLGSHTFSHADLTELPPADAIEEIERGHAAVVAAAGDAYAPFFRFPMFATTPDLLDAAANRGLAVVHANIVTEDWMTPDPDELLGKAIAAVEAEGSGVVLFHDLQPQTADMLDAFLTRIAELGYEVVALRPRPTLASLAREAGVHVGSVVWTPTSNPDRRFLRRAVSELDLWVVPAYARVVQPADGVFDFSIPDQTADTAPDGVVFRVHNLAWCELIPEWITEADPTGEELEEILVDHVTEVVSHYEAAYPGRVVAYDVVNEPLSWTGEGCLWHRIGLERGLGDLEYVRVALEAARDAAPDATLYLNDFLIEGLSERSDAMYDLVTDLLDEGVPIDGVGLQSHFTIGSDDLFGPLPPTWEIEDNLERYADLGIEVSITEADFSIPDDLVSTETLQDQATDFAALAGTCLDAPNCAAFVTWGVGDEDSWIPDFFDGWGSALLFDLEYEPKPAYHAVVDALDTR